MASLADTPPDGAIGYSATGRRLFLEYDADRVVRTNVIEYLFGDE